MPSDVVDVQMSGDDQINLFRAHAHGTELPQVVGLQVPERRHVGTGLVVAKCGIDQHYASTTAQHPRMVGPHDRCSVGIPIEVLDDIGVRRPLALVIARVLLWPDRSLMPQFLYPVDLYSAEYHRQSPAAMSH